MIWYCACDNICFFASCGGFVSLRQVAGCVADMHVACVEIVRHPHVIMILSTPVLHQLLLYHLPPFAVYPVHRHPYLTIAEALEELGASGFSTPPFL